MPKFSSDKHKVKKRARFQFELLEPRHLFSVNPLDLPSSDTPALELTVTAPQPELQADQALTNFTWLPLVFAGVDKIASVSSSLLLTGDVIVNATANLSVAWSKVSGPGNALFGNSSSVSSSVQFDQAGTYELQLAATNGGLTSIDRVFVTVTASNTINIDQAWLNAQGPGPYYLDQAGKNYVLQTDVTTKGTAFAIVAKDVTFDLNGHTITYNNAAPITIPNGSFEQGSGTAAAGWNFANAPGATRYQGVWLQNEVYDGSYSLKFSDTRTNQYVQSTTTITLEPNTTYSLSAMFEYGGKGTALNPGAKGYVRLVGNGLPSREVFFNGTNYRGIQLREQVFTTGSSPQTYTIQVGIEGDASSAHPIYIDDIKIQRTRTYGVAIGPKGYDTSQVSDITKFADASGAIVKNGTLIQGSDTGTWAHGVFSYENYKITIDNLNITVHGANSSPISTKDHSTIFDSVITNNTLTSNVLTVTTRDHQDGAMIYGCNGIIAHNTLLNGPHAGIVVGRESDVYDNTIKLSTRYTNAFGIIAYDLTGNGSKIHDNSIDSTGPDQSSCGILVDGTAPTKVYNNTINVKLRANNQEYEGPQYSGAYGLQLEKAQNKEVYSNTVTVYSDVAEGAAFRMTTTEEKGVRNNYIHDNVFAAVDILGAKKVFPFSFLGIEADANNRIEGNTLRTNSILVGDAVSSSNITLINSTIEFTGTDLSKFRLVEVMDWNPSEEVRAVKNLELRDTVFANPATRLLVESGDIRQYVTQSPMQTSYLSQTWTTTIQASDASGRPLAGSTISIKDKDGNIAYSGTTDAGGRVVAVLKQHKIQGANKTLFNDYTLTVTSGGNTRSLTFTADKKQTLTVQLGFSLQSLNQTSDVDLAGLALEAFLAQQFTTFQTVEVLEEAVMEVMVEAEPLAPTVTQRSKSLSINSFQQPDENADGAEELPAGLSELLAQ